MSFNQQWDIELEDVAGQLWPRAKVIRRDARSVMYFDPPLPDLSGPLVPGATTGFSVVDVLTELGNEMPTGIEVEGRIATTGSVQTYHPAPEGGGS